MPRRRFTKPDEVVLIYYDPDDENNNIVMRYFEGDIPNWVSHINMPVRDINSINARTQGKRFKTIIEDVPP